MKSSYYSIYGKQLILPPLIYLNPIKFRAPLIFALAIFVQWNNSYIRALTKILFSRRSKLWLEMFSKKLCEICRNTGFLWSVFSPIWTESYSYFLMFGQNQRFGILIFLLALTLSWRRSLSYRNQSIDLLSKSMGWLLYDRVLGHERVNVKELWFAENYFSLIYYFCY